mgnify:CR=1 FL=1
MKPNFFSHLLSSMLARLILYFVLIIMITLSLSSYFTYNYFSSAFKDDVTLINSKTLDQLSIFCDDFILRSINETLINLILDKDTNSEIAEFFEDYSTADSELLIHAFKKLKNVTFANREFIDTVFIHSKEKDLLISSDIKRRFIEDSIDGNDEFNWIKEFYKSNSNILWVRTRNTKVYSDVMQDKGDIITVICSYPISSTPNEAKGLVAINIKESSLSKYLIQFNSMNFGQLLIIDNKGNIISHSDKEKLYSDIVSRTFIKAILNSKICKDFVYAIDKEEFVISYTRSKFNNWYYISMIPIELFYQKDFHIKQKILITSLIILLSVFLFSNFFSFKIYIPLKRILENYKTMGNRKGITNVRINEYNALDSLFSNMSSEINYLQDTLQKNMTIIQQNLLNDLINNRINNPDELDNMLNFTNINFSFNRFTVIVFSIDKYVINEDQQNAMQLYKYSISDFINSLNSENNFFYYCVQISSYDISVIVNTSQSDTIDTLIEQVDNYSCTHFNFHLTSGVGQFVDNPLLINKSYKSSRLSIQYKFINPDKHVFYYDNLKDQITSEATIPDDFCKKLDKYIKSKNYNELEVQLHEFVSYVRNNNVACKQVRKEISKYISLYIKDVSEMDINLKEIDAKQIKLELLSSNNIDEFVESYLKVVYELFDLISEKKLRRNSELVDSVKQYVQDNLHLEISLNKTANAFYISPYYLSKIFKEEAGINYIEYVVQCKMEKATNLLESTNLSIEEVTNSIGYRHTSYFTRKFKEFCGKTPNEYRIGLHLKF